MTLPKTWIDDENLTNEDLNDNFEYLRRLVVDGEAGGDVPGGFSRDVNEMQSQVSPGDVGSESLPDSLKGEIQRIRYQLDEIIGKDYWYERPSVNLEALSANFGLQGSLSGVLSGKARANGFPAYLKCEPSGLSVSLDVAGAPLTMIINGRQVVQSTSLSVNLLPPASTSNTASLMGAIGKTNSERRMYGESPTPIIIDTVGSSISSKAGSKVCLNVGGEPILGLMLAGQSSNYFIVDGKRGWFFDDTGAPIKASSHVDNSVVTLLSSAWIFYRNDGVNPASIFASYNEPSYSPSQPETPSFNDMWFDLSSKTWKVFNGSIFVESESVFIGYACANTTDVVGVRPFEFFSAFSESQNITAYKRGDSLGVVISSGSHSSVYGQQVLFPFSSANVLLTSLDPDSGALTTNTTYWMYIDKNSSIYFSDISPNYRPDMLGMYHPFAPARCFGSIVTDISNVEVSIVNTSVFNIYFRQKNSPESTSSTSAVDVSDSAMYLFVDGPGSISVSFEASGTGGGIVHKNSQNVEGNSRFSLVVEDLISGSTGTYYIRDFRTFYPTSGINYSINLPLETLNFRGNANYTEGYSYLFIKLQMYGDTANITTTISPYYSTAEFSPHGSFK